MIRVSADAFERIVAEGLDEIPEPFADLLENVHVVVEDEPTPEDLAAAGLRPGEGTLYGLYHGVPQTERGPGYTFAMPDRITIYRGPLCRACRSRDELREQVMHTVIHEVAHHFGIDDDRLDELGW